MRLGEILAQRFDGCIADPVNAQHFRTDNLVGQRLCGSAKRRPAAIGPSQKLGRVFADMADAQRVEEAPERNRPPAVDG